MTCQDLKASNLLCHAVVSLRGAKTLPSSGGVRHLQHNHVLLLLLQVVCGTMGMPTATVQMKGPDGISRIGVGVGTGEQRQGVNQWLSSSGQCHATSI